MRALTCTLTLATLLCGSRAGAQPADDELGRAHFRTAQAYYQRDKFVDAAREFEEAYRLSRRGEILFNIGKSYDHAGDLVRGRAAYRSYLAALPASSDAAEVARRAGELDALVGHLTLVAKVDGAEVSLDGVVLEAAALAAPIDVNPGSHQVVATREGYHRFERTLAIPSGQSRTLELALEALPKVREVVMVERREKAQKPAYKQWWLWTAVGVVVVGAVVGGVLGARATDAGGEIETPIPAAR